MATDIFISYSRKDTEHALELAERLRASGMEIWIDQGGIEAATSWSGEIVRAIEASSALIVLLSKDSVQSDNVVRELSLAFEKKKRILPISVGTDFIIPHEMQYQLAGIQRAHLADFDGIVRSLVKLGVAVGEGRAGSTDLRTDPRVGRASLPDSASDTRKSLIVLPFEDLSPSGEDNAWFADGLAGELIDAFGHIKSLRILDRKTSIGLRGAKLQTVEIGKEFNTRYFIEGSVRKFGEQIKISVSLLDIETGDYLWQESHRGEFKDIFDIQEAVAEKVVEGLKLHLTNEEKTLVKKRGTENAEAYELELKGEKYFLKQTKEGFEFAIQLFREAMLLDPHFITPYFYISNAQVGLYRSYKRDIQLLEDAKRLIEAGFRLNENNMDGYIALTSIYQLENKIELAELTAKEFIRNAPDNYMSHFTLGYLYLLTSQYAKAIEPFEEAVKLKSDYLPSLVNVALSCHTANEPQRVIYWASVALPVLERYIKIHPDEEAWIVCQAMLLHWLGRDEDALKVLGLLSNVRDGNSLFNMAVLRAELKDYESSLKTFRKAIESGFVNLEGMRSFLNDEDNTGIGKLRQTPEYEEVKLMVEKIEAEQLAAAASNTEEATAHA